MFRANPKHSYLMEMEEFNSILLEDFVNSYGKTLLLLGDGVFVDAHYLKRKLGNQLYIQRILNMYQFQKTIVKNEKIEKMNLVSLKLPISPYRKSSLNDPSRTC